jgi:hypothetical protein
MDELSNIAPKLSKIKKGNPYRIPENYFEELPGRISETIHAQKETEQVKHLFLKKIRPHLAVAASIVVFTVIGYFGYKLIYSNNSNIELTSGEITDYVEYYSSEIEENMFIEMLEEDKLPEADYSDLSDEIITYLVDENIDYQSIIDVL